MVTRLPRRWRRQGPASLLERCEPGIPHLRVIEGFSRVCQGLRVCRESVASLWKGLSKGCTRGCASFRESYGAHRAAGRTPCASGGGFFLGTLQRTARGLQRVSASLSAKLRGHTLQRVARHPVDLCEPPQGPWLLSLSVCGECAVFGVDSGPRAPNSQL